MSDVWLFLAIGSLFLFDFAAGDPGDRIAHLDRDPVGVGGLAFFEAELRRFRVVAQAHRHRGVLGLHQPGGSLFQG